MPQLGVLHIEVLDSSGNAVSGANVTVYREGATVSGNQSGVQPFTINVRHRGKFADSGDALFVNASTGTTYAVIATTQTTVQIGGFLGTLGLSNGDRLTPINLKPTLYSDDQGSSIVSNPLTTNALGYANCFVEYGAYDIVISGGGMVTTARTEVVMPTEAPGQVRYADAFNYSASITGGIQEAVNDLPSAGGTVRLSANKTYTLTAAVTLPDNVEVVGGGYSTIVKKNPGSSIGCFVNSGANGSATGTQNNRISIRNLKILGSNSGTTTYGIRMENVDNFRIENVWCQDILNGDSAAIDIDSCQHFFVRGCYINNVTNNGIKVRCQAENSTDFVISDNIVDTTAAQNGIFVANSTSFAASRFTITGNVVKSAKDVGIEVGNTGATAHTSFTVEGNQVWNASGDGILIRNASKATISGNQVTDGGNAGSSSGIGVLASAVDCTDISVFGNCVAGRSAGVGIRTGLSSTFRPRRINVSGNTLRGATGCTDGISAQGFLEDSSISNNIITSWDEQGIEINGSTAACNNLVIIGNVIGNCVSHAISLNDVDDSIISDNAFFNNGTNDINWSGSSNTNNVAKNNHGSDGNSVQNITAAATAIVVVGSTMELTADNNYTLSATPTIADGFDQQEIIIINVDSGADVITLQDQGTLPSSNLRLGAATRAIGPRDSIRLRYNATIGDWIEVAFSNVT